MLNLLSYNNFLFSLSIGITFWLIYAKNCYLSYSKALEGLKVSIAWWSAQAEELISPSVPSGCSWFPPFLCHGSCKRHLSLSHCLSQQNVAVLVNPLFLTPTPHGPLPFIWERTVPFKTCFFTEPPRMFLFSHHFTRAAISPVLPLQRGDAL